MTMKELILSWGVLILSIFFNVYGVFVIKLKINKLGPIPLDTVSMGLNYFFVLLKSPLVVSGVILFFIAPFLFAVALSRMEIAVAYPAQVGLNFLFLILLAVIFLGEEFTFYKILGIIFVLVGVYLLHKAS